MTSRSRSHARRLEYALQQAQATGLQEKLLERLERLLKEMVYWGIPITQEALIAMLRWMGPTRSTEIIEGQCEVFEVDQKLVEEIRKSFLHEPMRRWIEAMIDSDNIDFGFDVVGYCRQFEDKSDKSWSHSASVAYYYGTQPGVGSSLHSPH
ncbi:hypothetical protein BDP81DRAFT_145169 [Colletotrichum phormii]|uniref:Uncharacterized protein n=1 Tax=Colletotrichum phormii TaxID=359342 RepID=A0AAI9ZEB0_9PEZI|nr:uncharacterized protein BDP81DRAFT_145169 [Colletotrichum phormii]KAK1622648.1 hypothetical protein BDP81DRAFT_145169 [Colletotrichum phormii]